MCQRSYFALLQLLLFVVGPAIVDWQDTDSLIKLVDILDREYGIVSARGSYCFYENLH